MYQMRSGLGLVSSDTSSRALGIVDIDHVLKTGGADFQTTQRFLQRLLEGAADGHHLAHRFHLRGQARIAPANFSKAKRGILVTT